MRNLIFASALFLVCGLAQAELLPVPPDRPITQIGPTIQSTIKRMLMNPEGELDGFILDNGAYVKFPPHMSSELAAVAKQGDSVSVDGVQKQNGEFKAFSITNVRDNKKVVEHEPYGMRLPKHLRALNLKPLNAEGKIDYLLRGKRGEVKGVVVSDGSTVRFPKHVAEQFTGMLQLGAPIAARGYGTENQYGRALEATAVGQSMAMLTPIYEGRRGRR